MDKNTYYETVKNMRLKSIKPVLLWFRSITPCPQKVAGGFARLVYVVWTPNLSWKTRTTKATAFMIENLVHLWVTWKSLSQELALAISDPTSYLNRIKGWMNPIQTFLCPCYQRLFRIFPLKYPQKPQPPYSDDELNKIKDDLKSELDLFKQRNYPNRCLLY